MYKHKLEVNGENLFSATDIPTNTSATGTNIISAGGTMGALQALVVTNADITLAAGKTFKFEVLEDSALTGAFTKINAMKEITAPAAIAAVGTITIGADNMTAETTITIGNTTLTAKASGASTNQFNIGATAALTASAIAALTVTGVTLSASGSVVTVTASTAGAVGNAITLTSDDAAVTVSGAKLSGGSDGGFAYAKGTTVMTLPLLEPTKDYIKGKMTTNDSSAAGKIDAFLEYLPR